MVKGRKECYLLALVISEQSQGVCFLCPSMHNSLILKAQSVPTDRDPYTCYIRFSSKILESLHDRMLGLSCPCMSFAKSPYHLSRSSGSCIDRIDAILYAFAAIRPVLNAVDG